MFGVIYKNTQYHLLKDTLMSFGLSSFFPIILYLFKKNNYFIIINLIIILNM